MTLDITALSGRGEGIARQDGRTIAVPLALPGERIIAEVNDDRGTVVEILAASPARARPLCRHFGTCGGCSVQHLATDAYRDWKLSLVISALERRGVACHAPRLLDAHGAGRRRVCFHARHRGGVAAIGFMAARSHQLVPISACPVLAPQLAAAPAIALDIASQFIADDEAFDILLTATPTGLDCELRGLRRGDRRPSAELARLLDRHSVVRLSINGQPLIETAKPMVRCSKAVVPLPPGGFLQATEEAERLLAEQVSTRLAAARRAADLFCGIGPFAFRLAERRPVTAIDSDARALAALDFAVRHTAGLKPVATERRDLFREPLTARELQSFDAVVFDPPRQGADAQTHELARSSVTTVIAVSCNAATFARDAATLLAGGYRMSELTAIDQFRWSAHVELVATFARV